MNKLIMYVALTGLAVAGRSQTLLEQLPIWDSEKESLCKMDWLVNAIKVKAAVFRQISHQMYEMSQLLCIS